MSPADHGPGVRIPPPLMVGLLLAVAWGLHRLVPVPLGPPLPEIGVLLLFAALGLAGWAVAVLARAGNDPRPDRPDATMVETGPFRFTRNPIYLGLLVAMLGCALLWGDLWGWVALPLGHLLLDRLVVAKEEAYLATRFGGAYDAYRSRVRRWL